MNRYGFDINRCNLPHKIQIYLEKVYVHSQVEQVPPYN